MPRLRPATAGALLMALCAAAVPASAQTAAPALGAAQPDPVFAAAQKAFESLPEADRKAIQDDLVWATDFRGGTSGSFGPLTFKAVSAFQKQAGATVDGILKPEQRAAIAAAANKARASAKFSVLVDGKTGVRIGVPQRPRRAPWRAPPARAGPAPTTPWPWRRRSRAARRSPASSTA